MMSIVFLLITAHILGNNSTLFSFLPFMPIDKYKKNKMNRESYTYFPNSIDPDDIIDDNSIRSEGDESQLDAYFCTKKEYDQDDNGNGTVRGRETTSTANTCNVPLPSSLEFGLYSSTPQTKQSRDKALNNSNETTKEGTTQEIMTNVTPVFSTSPKQPPQSILKTPSVGRKEGQNELQDKNDNDNNNSSKNECIQEQHPENGDASSTGKKKRKNKARGRSSVTFVYPSSDKTLQTTSASTLSSASSFALNPDGKDLEKSVEDDIFFESVSTLDAAALTSSFIHASADADLMNHFLLHQNQQQQTQQNQQNVDVQYTVCVPKHEFDSLRFDVDALSHKVNNLSKELRKVKVSSRLNPHTSYSYLDVKGHNIHMTVLSSDSFSLMKVTSFGSLSWLFSVSVTIVQLVLLIMIVWQQCQSNETDLNIPFQGNVVITMAQFMAIIVTVAVSKDLFIPIKEVTNLWYTNPLQWTKVAGISMDHATYSAWLTRIVFPNAVQFTIGALALLVSFIIIIQCDDVIELFAEFAAMSIIAEIDDIAFWFADSGYVGNVIRKDAKRVREVQFEDNTKKTRFFGLIQLRSVMFLVLLVVMMSAYTFVAFRQNSGYYFEQKYPHCAIPIEDMRKLGDGSCDGGIMNTYQCGFDHGDCIDFNIAYPSCNAVTPEKVGDGTCEAQYNIDQCGFDGGDCCPVKGDKHMGDGICHAGFFNTAACLYDNGDCT